MENNKPLIVFIASGYNDKIISEFKKRR